MAESSIYEGYKQLQRRGSYDDERARAARAADRMALHAELNRDRTWGERASDLAIGGLQGAVSLGSSAYGLGNMMTGGGLEWATGMAGNFERTNQILQNAKSTQLLNSLNQANQAFDQRGILSGVKEYLTNPELMVDLGATNAASVLPAAAGGMWAANRAMQAAGTLGTAAARTAATKAATRTATAVGGAQAGGAAYTEAYNQAIAEGLSPEEANLRAQGAGYATEATTAAISRMPGIGAARTEGEVIANLAKAPSAAAAAKGFGSSLATATRAETAEEFFQSGAEQGIQNLASTERELFDDVGKAAAVGGLGGGVLGVAMGSVPATRQLRSDLTNIMDESA